MKPFKTILTLRLGNHRKCLRCPDRAYFFVEACPLELHEHWHCGYMVRTGKSQNQPDAWANNVPMAVAIAAAAAACGVTANAAARVTAAMVAAVSDAACDSCCWRRPRCCPADYRLYVKPRTRRSPVAPPPRAARTACAAAV